MRKWQIKITVGTLAIIVGLTFLIPIIVCVNGVDLLVIGIVTWVSFVVLYALIFLSVALYYYIKIRYLLKNYRKLKSKKPQGTNTCGFC